MLTESDLDSSNRVDVDASPAAARLLSELGHATAQFAQLAPEVERILDDGDVIQEDRDAARNALELARKNVASATSAVERLRAGTYGLCAGCGRPIGEE